MQLTATGDLQLQITVRLTKAQQDTMDTTTRSMPITMTERTPRAWQDTPRGRVDVPVQFTLANGCQGQLTIDPLRQLGIDPP